MHKKQQDELEVAIGEEFIVMNRRAQSRRIVARILGRERDATGENETIWLDRRVHRATESLAVEGERKWSLEGAISTVMTTKLKDAIAPDEMTPAQMEAAEASARIQARIAEPRGRTAA